MQLIRWISLCAITGGIGVALSKPILGGEYFAAITGGNTDLLIMGGGVALVGVCTLLINALEEKNMTNPKGPSG